MSTRPIRIELRFMANAADAKEIQAMEEAIRPLAEQMKDAIGSSQYHLFSVRTRDRTKNKAEQA